MRKYCIKSSIAHLAIAISAIILVSVNSLFAASWGDVIITEMLADTAQAGTPIADDDNDEFIELYNRSGASVDLADWIISDIADVNDTIRAWDMTSDGVINDVDVTTNTTVVPNGYYVVILDPEYSAGNQPYDFPENTVIVTIADTGLGSTSLTETDPPNLYLVDDSAVMISSWSFCTDTSQAAGASVEMANYLTHNETGNWAECADDSQQGAGHYSTPGAQNSNYTGGEISADSVSPAAISSLTALPGSTGGTVSIKWTAPGDDGTGGGNAIEYLVKYATSEITSSNFYDDFVTTYTAGSSWTPTTAGSEETGRVVSGLTLGTTYWFAVKAKDDNLNWSIWPEISIYQNGTNSINAAFAQIQTDFISPSAISNLTALTGSVKGTVSVKWTAPGDDGNSGSDVIQYLVKYATSQITAENFYDDFITTYTAASSWTPSASGTEETDRVISGLTPGATYYFAVKARDEVNNWSSWSSAQYASESNKAYAKPFSLHVVINEVFYDPSPDSGYEWIELYNQKTESVDLSGWKIQSGGTSFSDLFTITSATIEANSYYLLGMSSVSLTGVTPDYIYDDGSTMQNGGSASDGVRLIDEISEVMDTILYDSPNTNNLPGDEASPGTELCPDVLETHSLSRVSAGVDTDSASDWEDLTTPTPTNSSGLDSIAPAAISSLTALTGTSGGTVNLKWTAPGDDGAGAGNVSQYLIKYATSQITSTNFYDSFVTTYTAASAWTPATAGTEETGRVVSGLTQGTTYYFAVRASDSTGNMGIWPDLSIYQNGTNSINSAFAYTVPAPYSWGDILITEVLAVTAGSGTPVADDDNDEFIEIYNNSGDSLDVAGWKISDGDAVDTIEAWDMSTDGYLNDVDVTTNTTVIPNGFYAVILDPEYYDGGSVIDPGNQPYNFPANTIILTVGNTTLGDNLIASDMPNMYLTTDTDLMISSWSFCTDTSQAAGASVEMINYGNHNQSGNWVECIEDSQNGVGSGHYSTPGAARIVDISAPAAISSLTALTGTATGTISLEWIAPGDDGPGGGNASEYLVKYATSQITSTNFYDSFVATYTAGSAWTPTTAGAEETGRVVSGLTQGTTYYFAIKASDNSGNIGIWPDLSIYQNGTSSINSAFAKVDPAGAPDIVVTKSTSTALAKPDDTITYTLTYSNNGGGATNFQIIETIPFNVSLNGAATGTDMTIEYWYSSQWNGSWDSSAEKIRWTRATLGAGVTNQTVSYTVDVRVAVSEPVVDIVDDFESDASNWGAARWSGAWWTYDGEWADSSTTTVRQVGPNLLEKSYWIGWGNLLGTDGAGGGLSWLPSTVDVSTYSELSFWIWPLEENMDISIELVDSSTQAAVVQLRDYLTPAASTWNQVSIPLEAFERENSDLNIALLWKINFSAFNGLGNLSEGNIWLDNIAFTKQPYPPANSVVYSGGDNGTADTEDQKGDTVIWWDTAVSSITTNIVETKVDSVYSIGWSSVPADSIGSANSTVYLPYQLNNNCNNANLIQFSTTTISGENWDAKVYWDANENGSYDAGIDTDTWNTEGALPGTTYYFLLGVDIPVSASEASASTIRLTAKNNNGSGANDSWPTASDDDTITDDVVVTAQGTNLSLVKSTSTASAKPGEDITVTLSYGNSGSMQATNIQIVEVIPTNTYLSEAATVGNDETVNYYHTGSGWNTSWSGAEMIRFQRATLNASTTNQQVSYILKVN